MNERWIEVDRYLNEMLVAADPALEAALRANQAAGLPAIDVSPSQGKFLHLLALIREAGSILEIGTLGGYSTIWLARALPSDGHLVTLEIDPHHAEVARKNLEVAGVADLVELRVGAALDSLARLVDEGAGPFDLIFIDADKPSNPDYFSMAMELSRVGTVIVIDNMVRDGEVIDERSTDPGVRGVRRLNELLAAEARVTATALQTVGSKGYDGFATVLVTAER